MTPTPPEGYRLLTDKEKTMPLPMDAQVWFSDTGWINSTLCGYKTCDNSPYATRSPATPPAEGPAQTVETDAAEREQEEKAEYIGHVVPADFARKLERERDEARAERDSALAKLADLTSDDGPMWQALFVLRHLYSGHENCGCDINQRIYAAKLQLERTLEAK